ncbi:MAG TPA: MBL fold metallo-hydrolase [Micromonosporaceae bacterium]|nr:MBL fold metallo-hydrolase [Micromonosporaceae bacterium]
MEPYRIADRTHVIPLTLPIPSRGLLYLNPLVILGREPVIVDTGPAMLRQEYLDAVFSVVEPEDVRWIFLSHDDRDHAGNVMLLLDLCRNARLVTNFQGATRLNKEYELPMERIIFVDNGEAFDAGDRRLVSLRPPLFDNPSTRGLLDVKTHLYYSVDAFAAVVPTYVQDLTDVPPDVYEDGFNWLNRANAPWYALTDPDRLQVEIDHIRRLEPAVIVSYHGPVAYNRSEELCKMLAAMPRADPIQFPSYEELAKLLAEA